MRILMVSLTSGFKTSQKVKKMGSNFGFYSFAFRSELVFFRKISLQCRFYWAADILRICSIRQAGVASMSIFSALMLAFCLALMRLEAAYQNAYIQAKSKLSLKDF